MQNRYAGDVGDFVKLGLLRHLAKSAREGGAGLSVGVNWYLAPDERHNGDGKHVTYLSPMSSHHQKLAACDAELMRILASVVKTERTVRALESSGALPNGTPTYSEVLSPTLRPDARRRWHGRALSALAAPAVIFADPDNGIRGTAGRSSGHKFAFIDELAQYAERGQSLIVYQHADRSADAITQARRRLIELADGVEQQPVGAIIVHRGSCRFLLVTATTAHSQLLTSGTHAFCARWLPHVELVE